MTRQSQKQKDADASAKKKKTVGLSQTEGVNTGFNSVNNRGGSRENLNRNPGTAQPVVTQTRDDRPDAKVSGNKFENGFIDGPDGGGNASSAQSDARRDSNLNQKPNPPKEDLV
jgi:hypothetical protein